MDLFVSQSPSLRGSGRFEPRSPNASTSARSFQSPSLRGSGRFPRRKAGAGKEEQVSIPFIAGQWSLRRRARPAQLGDRAGFNPLHCGAVVASRVLPALRKYGVFVSIPFIAGQWSLREWRYDLHS